MSGIDLRVKKLFRGKKNLVISALNSVINDGVSPEDASAKLYLAMTDVEY